MAQILHGCATTTQVTRREIQNSEASIRSLAREHGVDKNTVLKWRKRDFVHDAPMGPKERRSTVLSRVEEAVCVGFRRHTLLPLDDCLYSLQSVIPHLSRASLWRCFRRHGIQRLPLPEEGARKVAKKRFEDYPIGYFHIDIAEVRTEEGVLQLFVAIDRTSKFVYARLYEKKTKAVAAAFLCDLIARVPFRIHTILTDNGIQFTNRKRDRSAPVHDFDRVCGDHGIEHRLTQVGHPWTNGQVERMNRTIKGATVKKYYYSSPDQLGGHLNKFLDAYNFARRLKSLRGKTPWEEITNWWTNEPERFLMKPSVFNLRLNT